MRWEWNYRLEGILKNSLPMGVPHGIIKRVRRHDNRQAETWASVASSTLRTDCKAQERWAIRRIVAIREKLRYRKRGLSYLTIVLGYCRLTALWRADLFASRRAEQCGLANHAWRDRYHTFSGRSCHHPDDLGFSNRRLVDHATVASGGDMATPDHTDMEISGYRLAGALEHEDSQRNGSVIRAGDRRRTSAGSGVKYREYNRFSAQRSLVWGFAGSPTKAASSRSGTSSFRSSNVVVALCCSCRRTAVSD